MIRRNYHKSRGQGERREGLIAGGRSGWRHRASCDRAHYAPSVQECGVRNEISRLRIRTVLSTTTSADPLATMSADQDESAKLWKVNRTIHELVKDRVCRVERQ